MKIWILTKKDHFQLYENIRFLKVAKKTGIDVLLVAPEEIDIITTQKGETSLFYCSTPAIPPDCLIPRMGCGTTYLGSAIIRHCERSGIHVLNNSQSIELSKDKLSTMQVLTGNNLPVPKSMLVKFPFELSIIKKNFQFPLIVKTVIGSQGKGIYLCENSHQLEDLIYLLETTKDPRANYIIQEFIQTSKGRDIRIIIIGNKVIGAALRTAKDGTFKANYTAGGTIKKYSLDRNLEWLALEAAKSLGLNMAGIDILFSNDGYKICEVNSSPGFEGFEKAVKINIPLEVYNYIFLQLEGCF